jgi:HSP20 family protein
MTFVKVNNPATKNFDGLMKDIFNEIPASLGKTFREDVLGFPPVNITESASAYHLEVAAPGIEKTDFNIKIEGTLLVISAVKKDEGSHENVKSIRKEFSNKGFKRSFTGMKKLKLQTLKQNMKMVF